MIENLIIRKYNISDEESWLKCRLISFHDSAYYDDVYTKKPVFNNSSLELVAELNGKIVGIAHYRTMPRPIKGQYIGFLDDLFVEPEFRGQKIAQKLISHLKSLSKANNWNGIRWITHSSNENAKKLYDKIANNTGFELYELKGN